MDVERFSLDASNPRALLARLARELAECNPGDRYAELYELIASEAEDFTPQPLPRGVRRCAPKSCYHAAFTLASRRDDLDYVEGFAIGALSLPIQHAWCADAEGHVIDRVWGEPGHAYLGFRIPLE
jgi:hypothetical protein